jgi:Flp pilus assembly protein TadD
VTRAPGDVRSWNMLGGFYDRIERPREAVLALRHALAEDPDLPEIQVNVGVALSQQGDRSGSENALRRAILLAPDLAIAHLNLGALLAAENRNDEARAELEVAAHSRLPEARGPALRLLQALPR